MFEAVAQLLRDHLPTNQEYVIRNLDSMVRARQRVKLVSIVILFITSTGVFLPLEVAFNRIWGFSKNRSYLGNQIVSLLLAFACGILALASVGLAAGNELFLKFVMLGNQNIVFRAMTFIGRHGFREDAGADESGIRLQAMARLLTPPKRGTGSRDCR